jgi:cyclopropane fatty-acyl-phospholipid synthase-like methyltransferase
MLRNGWARGSYWGRLPAPRARLPWLLRRRRTVGGVAAYFDLITDDGRLFFGDSFHFGYFPGGRQTLTQALDAHTDLVCELAGIRPGMRVLDVGCGIGEPARRIAASAATTTCRPKRKQPSRSPIP